MFNRDTEKHDPRAEKAREAFSSGDAEASRHVHDTTNAANPFADLQIAPEQHLTFALRRTCRPRCQATSFLNV